MPETTSKWKRLEGSGVVGPVALRVRDTVSGALLMQIGSVSGSTFRSNDFGRHAIIETAPVGTPFDE